MDIGDIRGKGDKELLSDLHGQREALRSARFELAAGRKKNIRAIRETRQTIAKMLTVLAERHRST
ncbi:MAG: 50S ribosomal protein L29 [Candidatus Terrybacteria bacterium]|nr:50S ribosomal protein L29 [Candidatus Terrybacteria bacterium]